MNLFYYILSFFISYIFIVLIHEGAHFIGFKITNIKILSIRVANLCFYNSNGLYLKITKPRLHNLTDAMIVFDIPFITNVYEWEDFKKKYSLIILLGPLATIFSVITIIIVKMLYYKELNEKNLINITILCFIFFSFYYIIAFFKTNQDEIGDLCLFSYIKKNDLAFGLLMHEYTLISTQYYSVIRSKCFLDNLLNTDPENFDYSNQIYINYLDNILLLYLTNHMQFLDKNIINILNKIYELPNIIDVNSEDKVRLLTHIIIMLMKDKNSKTTSPYLQNSHLLY